MENPSFYRMHRGMFQVWKNLRPTVIEFLYVESTNERYKQEIIRAVEYYSEMYCTFKIFVSNGNLYLTYPDYSGTTDGIIIIDSNQFTLLTDWFKNPRMPYHKLNWFNQFKIIKRNYNPFVYDANDFWSKSAQYVRGVSLNLMINIAEKDIDQRNDE